MLWLRPFGERGWRIRSQGGNSATGLCAAVLTACGIHLRPFRYSSSLRLLVSTSQGPRRLALHPFAKLAKPPRCAPTAMSSRWPSGRLDRTARSSLIRRKASLMSGFNSLLGPNYFPVPLCREFDCKYMILLVFSVRNLDIGSQNR